jgi:hypothetical protein
MPSPTGISVAQLSRIVGLPGAPMLVDVRLGTDSSSDRHVLPTARQMNSQSLSTWADHFSGRRVSSIARTAAMSVREPLLGFGKRASTPKR